MTTKLVAYKPGSESAKALADRLKIKRLKEEGSTWKGKIGDFVINWGRSSDHPAFESRAKVLNIPEAIAIASHKVKSFVAFQSAVDEGKALKIPMNTTSRDVALAWLCSGSDVVVRNIVQGHSGAGIEILKAADCQRYVNGSLAIPNAPLYTSYVRKANEYRLHVMNGEVFFIQRKARKLDVPDEQVNWQVRNLDGGFIYAHENVDVPQVARDYATTAVAALGLDFGAVDILETKRGNYFVLEVNTACGLAGTTLDKYAEAFQKHYNI